jgi:hypothetical protein
MSSRLITCLMTLSMFLCFTSGMVQGAVSSYEVLEIAHSRVYQDQIRMNDRGGIVFYSEGNLNLFTPKGGVKKIREVPFSEEIEIQQFSNANVVAGSYMQEDGMKSFVYYPEHGYVEMEKIILESLGIEEKRVNFNAINDQGFVVFTINAMDCTYICTYSIAKGLSVLSKEERSEDSIYRADKRFKFAALNNKNQVLLRNDEDISKFFLHEPGKKIKNLGDLGISKLLSKASSKTFRKDKAKVSAKSCQLNDQGAISGHIFNGIYDTDDEYASSAFIYFPDGKLYVSGLTEAVVEKKKLKSEWFCFSPLLDNRNGGVFFYTGQNTKNWRDMEIMISWPIYTWDAKGVIKEIKQPQFKLDGKSTSYTVHGAVLDTSGQVQMYGVDNNFELGRKYQSEYAMFIWNEKQGLQYLHEILPGKQFEQIDQNDTDLSEIGSIKMNSSGDILLVGDSLLLLKPRG